MLRRHCVDRYLYGKSPVGVDGSAGLLGDQMWRASRELLPQTGLDQVRQARRAEVLAEQVEHVRGCATLCR